MPGGKGSGRARGTRWTRQLWVSEANAHDLENLCLVRPLQGALVLETLYYAEDLRSRAEIQEAVAETEIKEQELAMARQLVESLSGEFNPAGYANEYRRDLRAMLDAKRAGQDVVRPEPVPEAPIVDLMEALKESVAAARASSGGVGAAAPRARRKRQPAH